MTPDLSVSIKNIKMKNPLTTASGTYGQGDVFEPFYDINILGALTTKTVTLKMREGNKPPRIAETSSGYINSIGLQNPGIKIFIEKYNSYFNSLKTPVIISIAGNTVEEYGELAKIVSNEMNASGIEINISCPNIKKGGLQFSTDASQAASVVKSVKSNTDLTIITKLTPNTDDNVNIAKACENEGSDAISVINTVKALAINLETRRPRIANVIGGLSGPAIKPIALRWVWELFNNIKIPIIGMGGIANATDALEFIVAGASAVAIGTANFFNPNCIPEIIEEMKQWMINNKIASIKDLKGTLKIN
ncbi:MAG: hypothetical protein ACD_79C01375G0005 [uncultured bacterium]|nr:MAG: hypothetical protein ACD_79C01375G0005 [uncultured bacterium]